MTHLRIAVGVAVAVLGVLAVGGHSPARHPAEKDIPKPKAEDRPPRVPLPKGHELMAAKLKESQAVLEGIALGDFPKVEKASVALARISQAAEFLNAGKSKEYELQINLFRRAAQTVTQKAKDKNIDGVVLGFQDMTLTCLKCHQHTRDNKPDARLPGLPSLAGK